MYCERNFKTKKALKEAVAAGERPAVFQPGPFPATTEGTSAVEGPHYPAPHTWYAQVTLEGGRIVKVK